MLENRPLDNGFKLLKIGTTTFIAWNFDGDEDEEGHCVPVENIIDIDFDFSTAEGENEVDARIVWEGPELDEGDCEVSDYLFVSFEGQQARDFKNFLMKFEVNIDEKKDTK